jgi:hypothetical protein
MFKRLIFFILLTFIPLSSFADNIDGGRIGGGQLFPAWREDSSSDITRPRIIIMDDNTITDNLDGSLNYSPIPTNPGGSDTHIQFNDNGSFGGDSNLTWNKTTKSLQISTDVGIGNNLTVAGTTTLSGQDADTVLNIDTYSDTAFQLIDAPVFNYRKAYGSEASPEDVVNGAVTGTHNFRGWLSGNWRTGAQIVSSVDGTPLGIYLPAQLDLITYDNAGNSYTMTLDSAGDVSLPNDLSITGKITSAVGIIDSPPADVALYVAGSAGFSGDLTVGETILCGIDAAQDPNNILAIGKDHAGFTRLEINNDNPSGGINMRGYDGSTVTSGFFYSNSLNIFHVGAQETNSDLFLFAGTPTVDYLSGMYMDGSTYNVGLGTRIADYPIHIEGTTASRSALAIQRNSTDSFGCALNLQKGRGALGSLIVIDGDILGIYWGRGWNGSATFLAGASMIMQVDGTPDSSSMPGAIIYKTNPGQTTVTERMRLDPQGNLGINTTLPDAKLDVEGDAIITGDLTVGGTSFLGDEGTANYVKITDSGILSLHGTAKVIRGLDIHISIPKRPVANPPGENTEGGFHTLDFNDGTDESIYIDFHLPHDYADAGLINIHFDYFVDTAPANPANVVWAIEYKKITHGDNFDFGSGTSTVTSTEAITTGTPANDKKIHETNAITLTTTGFTLGDSIYMRFYRDADNGSDSLTGDVRMIGHIHIEYLSDKLGS